MYTQYMYTHTYLCTLNSPSKAITIIANAKHKNCIPTPKYTVGKKKNEYITHGVNQVLTRG